MTKRLVLWLFATTLVSGCASTQFQSADSVVVKERQGRFSVQSQAVNQPVDAVQGGFVWRQLSIGWQLDLKSPLGATLARLTLSPLGASLEQPDSPTRRASSGEALLAEVLGAPVPMDALEDWIDGRVREDGRVTDIKRDDQGRVVSFEQAGWQVTFDRYTEAGPGLVNVRGQQSDRNINLRLVVDQPTS